MKRIVLSLAFWAASSGAGLTGAGIDPLVEFPNAISVETERAVLQANLPRLAFTDSNISTKNALGNQGHDLETFRQDYLEGLARKLQRYCEHLNAYELFSNLQLSQRHITKFEHLKEAAKIARGRSVCSAKNYANSPAWQLYDEYLQRYRAEVSKLERQKSRCMSQTACRTGQN